MNTISEESERVYNALNNSKTKEQDLNTIILRNDWSRRVAIRKYYDTAIGERSLLDDIKKNLSGDYKDLLRALFFTPVEYDCHQISRAVGGFPLQEETVYEIIFNRPYWYLTQLKEKYSEVFNKTLDSVLESNFKDNVLRNLKIIINTERSLNKKPDHSIAQNNAKTLYEHKENEWFDNEEIFTNIFAKLSPHELALALRYYFEKTGINFLKAIEKLDKKQKVFIKALLLNVINPPELFADKLYQSFKGLGTDTNELERIIVTRNEVDMHYIRENYLYKYKVELFKDIAGDTSGAYRDLLLALSERTPEVDEDDAIVIKKEKVENFVNLPKN